LFRHNAIERDAFSDRSDNGGSAPLIVSADREMQLLFDEAGQAAAMDYLFSITLSKRR
jgi:hypothetical protein